MTNPPDVRTDWLWRCGQLRLWWVRRRWVRLERWLRLGRWVRRRRQLRGRWRRRFDWRVCPRHCRLRWRWRGLGRRRLRPGFGWHCRIRRGYRRRPGRRSADTGRAIRRRSECRRSGPTRWRRTRDSGSGRRTRWRDGWHGRRNGRRSRQVGGRGALHPGVLEDGRRVR